VRETLPRPNPRPIRASRSINPIRHLALAPHNPVARIAETREKTSRSDQRGRAAPAIGPALVQPLEPMLLPKLRIDFADFPWSHCSIDQRLFTSESGCGARYGPFIRERGSRVEGAEEASFDHPPAPAIPRLVAISGGAFIRIVNGPRTARLARRFPFRSFIRLSPSEMRFGGARAVKEKRELSTGVGYPRATHRR